MSVQDELEALFERYGGKFKTASVSYATVADYCDSFDSLNSLATADEYLINVQRPWTLKAILGCVARGGKVLELSVGESVVGALLSRLGYEICTLDTESEQFHAGLLRLPKGEFDCVYTISLVESADSESFAETLAGVKELLNPDGVSLHTFGHVHKGRGAAEALSKLETVASLLGVSRTELKQKLASVDNDVETYFVSAESHNRLRGTLPYDEFPMQVRIGIQLVSQAADLRIAPSFLTLKETTDEFAWARELSDIEWLEFLSGTLHIKGRLPPALPPEEVQSMFVGSAGLTAFREAESFLSRLRKIMVDTGNSLRRESTVLDFGVGWGRLYRILLREVRPKNLIGADVDSKAVEICRQAMPEGTFLQVASAPPYLFSAGAFDLILLYSIFSHLSETLFGLMITEFARILKPGGIVAFTTLKLAHLEVWGRQVNEEHWRDHLRAARFDLDAWRQNAEAGEFLFVPTGGGDPSRPAELYGEAIVTETFLRRTLRQNQFELVHFSEPGDAPQAFVVLRRI